MVKRGVLPSDLPTDLPADLRNLLDEVDALGRVTVDPLEKVTAASDSNLPSTELVEPAVMEAFARTVPTNCEEYPIVALEPTDQKTFSADAPF